MKTVIYARVINSVSDEPIENGMVEIEDDILCMSEKSVNAPTLMHRFLI